MKVLAVLVFIAASALARSGPYLPSGWRPTGPAFLLPSEVQRQPENPAQDVNFQESEASGSDFLTDYGPPKFGEVSQDITQQELPETVTEQAFVVNEVIAEINEERNTENKTEVVNNNEGAQKVLEDVIEEVGKEYGIDVREKEETATSAILDIKDQTTTTESQVIEKEESIEERNIDKDISAEVTNLSNEYVTNKTEEYERENRKVELNEIKQENDDANSNIVSAVRANVQNEEIEKENIIIEEKQMVEEVKSAIKNIEEVLVSLDKEMKAKQIIAENNSEDTTNLRSGHPVPEGFLEYGPPGFEEYGPPKEDILRSTNSVDAPEKSALENKETRRRRFSPKFRSQKVL